MTGEVRIVLGSMGFLVGLALFLTPFGLFLFGISALVLGWGVESHIAWGRVRRAEESAAPAYPYAAFVPAPVPQSYPVASPSPGSSRGRCGSCGGAASYAPRVGRSFCQRCAVFS